MPSRFDKSKGPTQRQLQVGEEIRRLLTEILMRGDYHGSEELTTPVTVTEVRVGGDLKHAIAFVMPLSGVKGQSVEEVVSLLSQASKSIRHSLSKRVTMKFLPKVSFRADMSFDEAERINRLLHDERVRKDLKGD